MRGRRMPTRLSSNGAHVFTEDDLLPLSALQHLLFCERQCALIHVEQLWAENRLTVEGRHLHERADGGGAETRGGVRTVRSLAVRSLRLGLSGRADVVEFHADPLGGPPRPFPVEYKRGRPKRDHSDRVQLCAQALCLEEMLAQEVPRGAIYHYASRRRREVVFDRALRSLTEETVQAVRRILLMGSVPPPVADARCPKCSLFDACMPFALAGAPAGEKAEARLYDLRR